MKFKTIITSVPCFCLLLSAVNLKLLLQMKKTSNRRRLPYKYSTPMSVTAFASNTDIQNYVVQISKS